MVTEGKDEKEPSVPGAKAERDMDPVEKMLFQQQCEDVLGAKADGIAVANSPGLW